MKRSNKKLLVIIIAIMFAAALVAGGVVIYCSFFAKPPNDSEGVVGKISSDWDAGAGDETTSKSSGTQIPGYSTAEMNAGDKSLYLSIGNPKANDCGFYATLKLDNGTVLYKSDLLEPGHGLTEIPLSQTLEKGEYTAMVYYECVTLDEKHTPLNSAESEFTLVVK